MKINIYGKPYHTFDYYFHTVETILDLYLKYSFQFIDYIDGQFAIQLIQDDKEIWITDYYGLYPIFYNPIEKKVCINFTKDMDLEVEPKYIDFCKKNLDRDYYSSLPIKAFSYFDNFYQHNCNKNFSHYSLTPWKNWFILPTRSIVIIQKDKTQIHSYKYTLNEDMDINNILIESIKKTSNEKKQIILALSAGYDTRALFSIMNKYVDQYERYTYGIEDEYVTKNLHPYNSLPKFNTNNIFTMVNDNITIMNGMGDLYVHAHEIFYESFLKKYDIVYTGDGGNYFLGYENLNIPTLQYSLGNGHYYKHLSNIINLFLPYAQKRIIYNKQQKTKQNRITILLDVTKQNNEKLLKVPCYTKYLYRKNQSSNFPFVFNYNTKYDYIKKYISYMKNIY